MTLQSLLTTPKPEQIERDWYLIDARQRILGRLASRIARLLQGKHRPYYAPHWDMGDHVVVVNADKVELTGRKETDKLYIRHTGFPGGVRKESLRELRERDSTEIIRRAVKGMLPKNKLAKQMLSKLHIYAKDEHPHEAQQPTPIELGD